MQTLSAPATFRQSGSGVSQASGVFVELPGLGSCFYRQHLNPGKPTLLLVHGMVVSSGLNWFRLFPALVPALQYHCPGCARPRAQRTRS